MVIDEMEINGEDYVVVEGTQIGKSKKAVRGDFGFDEPLWIPKSCLYDYPEDLKENGEWVIKEWMAMEKGLI